MANQSCSVFSIRSCLLGSEFSDKADEPIDTEADVEPEDGTREMIVPCEGTMDLFNLSYGHFIGNAIDLGLIDGVAKHFVAILY